jgi:WD40 repeat protein
VLYHADLAFDRTGTRLASVDRGGVGRVWSVPAGDLITRTVKTYGLESLYSLEFESDDVIVASGPSGLLRRWSASDGADLGSIEPHAGLVASIAIDPARRVLVVGGIEHLALFEISGTTPGHSVDPYPPEIAAVLPEGSGAPTTISRDGLTVAALTSSGVWVWDRSKGSAGARLVPSASPGVAFSVTLSPDGTVLVVPYLDFDRKLTEIVVFDVATLDVTHRIEAQRGSLATISPDNRWLAFASISYPRTPTLEVEDLMTGRRSSLVDDLVAVTEDVDPVRGAWVTSMSFSPDSHLLAAGNHRGAAMIWDLSTLEPLDEPLSRGNGAVVDLEFGDSSDVIAYVSSSNDISLLDVATRTLVAPVMQSPSGLSIGLAMSPDGTKLLSGGSDGVRLWEVATGLAIGRPYPVSTPLGPTMQWLADADSFAVVTDLGIETWTTDPRQWRSDVCELAGRSLTDEEWARYGTDSPTPRC